nr:MAG TPA: DNA helix destabilizing protein [Caudoviricetes sp.]
MSYGIWNSAEKRFVFGIAAETPRKAERAFRKTCINWRQWRYEIKPIPEGFKNPRNPYYINLRKGHNTMNANEIIIPCRLSYANVWEARQSMEGDEMQYSCGLLIPKSDTGTLQRIKTLMTKIEGEAVTTKWGGKKPASYAHPLLRDGDTDPNKCGDDNYAGCFFLKAKANADHAPKIIDAQCNPIMDRDEVYSGCYANVKIAIFAYNNPKGGKGLSARLVAIQKTKDGERLGGDTGTEGFEVLSTDVEAMLG